MEYIAYFLSILFIVSLLRTFLIKGKRRKFVANFTRKQNVEPIKEDTTIDTSNSYQSKYLLTKNEYYEWKKLNQYATEKGLIICPKVRLLDIIEPRKNTSNYMSLLGRIQSKHVDFVICDKDLRIKGIIELDDNSHNAADRKERDQFVDQVLTQVGYKIIHVRSVTDTTLNFITNNNPEA